MIGPFTSATVAINVTDLAGAREWYSELLGRPADLDPADGIAEWELRPGLWLQLAVDAPAGGFGPQTLRLGVKELDATVAQLRGAGVVVDDPVTVPGVISFCDVRDPDGNMITLYQVLAHDE